MSKMRVVGSGAMLATAVVLACSEGGPMDVVMEGGGAGLPVACATWSCSGLACGYNTSYPAWACCVQNIYEGPGGYEQPLDSVPGYQCGTQGPAPTQGCDVSVFCQQVTFGDDYYFCNWADGPCDMYESACGTQFVAQCEAAQEACLAIDPNAPGQSCQTGDWQN